MVERTRRKQIGETAHDVLEHGGPAAVTMRAVADRLGILLVLAALSATVTGIGALASLSRNR
jgi:DNA-binding transcriptional regulator YbjK